MNRSLLNTSPAELIALATGRRGSAAHADAHRLVEKLGLRKLADAGAAEIQEICRGITPNAVQRLMAGVEIGLRIAELKSEYESTPRITSPASAIQFCRDHFGRMARETKQEEFWIVTLNTKNEPIDRHQITVGTLRNSLVHPREVFRPAIRDAANCILVLHNHPSGEWMRNSEQFTDQQDMEALGFIRVRLASRIQKDSVNLLIPTCVSFGNQLASASQQIRTLEFPFHVLLTAKFHKQIPGYRKLCRSIGPFP